jgi:3-oxoacyl-[acyl-carrier protein] reductase
MNRIDLSNRVAVVTGGAQGLGYAIADRLAASGARVALWDRDAPLVEEAAGQLGTGLAVVDQTVLAAVERATTALEAEAGRIDILIANAGIAGPDRPVVDYDPADWRRVIDINLTGAFYLARTILPGMLARDYGRIVVVASIAGKEGTPNFAAYSASKAGVIALTKSLGKETAHRNVAVNCVTPAAARTRLFDQLTQEHIDYMLAKIPRGRFLLVEEAAAMIAWLASEENSFTTGAVFDLSGGRATY